MKRIILASNNKDKIKEVKEILTGYDIISIKEAGVNVDVEENGTTFEENALIKARAIMKITGEVTMADDSGLEIDYLNKEPGVYSARYMGHDTSYDIKNAALLKRLEGVEGNDRSGRFVCAIAVCFPDGREIVKRGTMEGLIAKEIKGNNGFGYDPIVYKLFSYSCHYRNKLNFTWEGIDSAAKSLERLRNSYQINLNGTDELTTDDKEKLVQIEENFHRAINDDLNMPLAMSFVWEAARFEKKNPEVSNLLAKFDSVLGIKIDEVNSEKEEIPQEILDLVEQRKIARENKDWAKSDELRDLIAQKGYLVKDTKNGVEITKK